MSNRFSHVASCALMLAIGIASPARGAGPNVRSLLPAGGQRGTTVDVTFSGDLPTWPAQTWVDSPGLTLSPKENKGEYTIAVAADARPGIYWIRLYDAAGAAAPKPFVVGTIPEVMENEPNNVAAEALPSSTLVINGRLAGGGDVDHFAVQLAQGQTLVASLAAHEMLGSPMDAVLRVVSTTGRQLAFNHDQRGLDPEIIFTAPAAGRYVLQLFAFPSTPNSSIAFSGHETYVYRLTATTGGFVDYPWPLAATRGRETRVELAGWNIPDSLKSVTIKPAGEAIPPEGDSFVIFDSQLANIAVVAVEPHETLVEREPNDPADPQAIALPTTISGRIERSGDVDAYRFDGKQGEPLEFRLQSRALGYPLDAVLKITDADGKQLAAVDDVSSNRDPLLVFSPPADGSFRLLVSDLTRSGSPRHVYRLRAAKAEPTYEATADSHAYTVTPDKPVELTIAINRIQSFPEPVALTVSGLPEFVAASPAVSAAAGDDAYKVKLTLTSSGGTFSGPIRIRAEGTGPTKLARTVMAAIPDSPGRLADLWLTAVAAAK